MTKKLGAVPPNFASAGLTLRIGGNPIDQLIGDSADTPIFIYDLKNLKQRVDRIRHAFPRVKLHYAAKANPYEPVLRTLLRITDGVDIASEGELRAVIAAGGDPRTVSFAGPGKRDREIAAAIDAGVTLNCESEREVDRALAAGADRSIRPRLAVRVNPPFQIRGAGMRMGGGARPFGVDADRAAPLARRIVDAGAEWRGFHIFAGSQALDADAIIDAQRATIALAADLASAVGESPPLVNIGGGFGLPYFAGEQPLDIERIGLKFTEALVTLPSILQGTEFALELGRWLVGEAGVYLTRIVDRKVSHGKTFLIVDGGMHHQLAASGNFGQVVRRNFPVAIANRMDQPADEEVSIVGCLCTPLDRLADDVMLPRAEVGDLVAVFMAGAYGLTASPQAFLGHPPAREMAVG